MSNRVQLNVRVPPDFKDRLEEFAIEHYGSRYRMGEAVREGMNEFMDYDRFSRLEGKFDRILDEVEGHFPDEGEKRKNKDSTDDLSPTTKHRVTAIAFDLSDSAGNTVTTQQIEQAIENHAGTSLPTIRRYKDLLESRNVVFPTPRAKRDEWFTDPEDWTTYIDCQVRDGHAPEEIRDSFIDQYGWDWWTDQTGAEWPDEYEHRDSDPTFQ